MKFKSDLDDFIACPFFTSVRRGQVSTRSMILSLGGTGFPLVFLLFCLVNYPTAAETLGLSTAAVLLLVTQAKCL